MHPGLERRIAALQRRSVHSSDNREVRAVVCPQAHDACEYCLLPTVSMFHVEHIIPLLPLYWHGMSDAHLVLLAILPADECDRRGGMIVKGMGHGARDDTG